MSDNKNSYGNILKATGLFGGVQVFEILISIVRSKFIAILLGPTGMGISGMITSTTSLVSGLTGFGLGTSGVRDISKAYNTHDEYKKNYTLSLLRNLVWFTGLLGLVVTFVLAKPLSILSFQSGEYTWAFMAVSVSLLVNQLVVGQKALLQGTFHYSYLAKSALLGNICSLIITVPMYYFFGIKGIVPVIIANSLVKLLLSWYYARMVSYQRISIPPRQVLKDGKTMLGLGFAIAMSSSITLGGQYLLRIFISNYGEIADVGLYTAGIAIATTYMGVILTAMGTDYAPRLAAASDDLQVFNQVINRQLDLIIILLTPLIIAFIVFIREVVLLLYSQKFVPVTGMIEWIMFGMFFRAVSFCLSYAVVAKADSKRFFGNETIVNVYSLLFSIVGYKFAGFTGLGLAFCLTYVCYSLQMYILCRTRYGFRFEKSNIKKTAGQLLLVIIVLATTKIIGYSWLRYVIGGGEFAVSCIIAYLLLNKLIPVKSIINAVKTKLVKK